MEKIYDYLQAHKWLLWSVFGVTLAAFVVIGVRCQLEENIFKLLPKSDTTEAFAFTNLHLKDKVMVQVVRTDSSSVTTEEMATAMDELMAEVVRLDSADGQVLNTLYDIDPLMLLDAGQWVVEHGPGYLSLSEAQLDSLTTEEHIREQIHMWNELLQTDMGSQLYDLISYDPCGLSVSALPNQDMLLHLGEDNPKSPIQHNHLFAGEGKACVGFITPNLGPDDSHAAATLVGHIDEARAHVEMAHPGVKVLTHGTVILAGYNSERIRMDLVTTLGIALTVIIILLMVYLKQHRYLLLLLIPIAYGAFFALTTIQLARGWMSLMAFGLGVIVLGVALSYCLHMVIHYIYVKDVRRTIREQSKPVFLGALTTIGAFAGLLLTKSSLLQDFGAFALLTIIGTTAVSLIVMPHAFPKRNTPNKRAFEMVEKLNSFNVDRNWWICGMVIVWVWVCILFSGKYEFDSNLYHIGYVNDRTQEAIDSWNTLQNRGKVQQYYASVAPTIEEALEQLDGMEQVADRLYADGTITTPRKVSVLIPSLKVQEQRNEAWATYFTEDKQAEVWRRIERACRAEDIEAELFEPFRTLMAEPTEPELIAESGIISDEILANVVEEQEDKVLVYMPLKMQAEDKPMVNHEMDEVEGCMVVDPYFYSESLVDMIKVDFDKIMLISSVFVLILLLITYRSIWLALIAFLPMGLSWYTVLGAMALFGQPFNVINIVVSSFIFGIGVDYSIFIMDGLLKGEDNKAMVYHRTAITLSAFILVLCMFSLLFATHPALNSIAFPSLVGMITTMMLCYTIQPNLYRFYRYARTRLKDKKEHNKNQEI